MRSAVSTHFTPHNPASVLSCLVAAVAALGSTAYNQKLSELRSNAVKNNLTAKGISPDLMTTGGAGETRPIDTNKTPAGRYNNRRSEFTFEIR